MYYTFVQCMSNFYPIDIGIGNLPNRSNFIGRFCLPQFKKQTSYFRRNKPYIIISRVITRCEVQNTHSNKQTLPLYKLLSYHKWLLHGTLAKYAKLRVAHAPEMPGTFSPLRGLAIPTCITERAWRTYRDACRDRKLVVFFEIGGGENVPGIHGACATRNFAYLVRGPLCEDPMRQI